MTGSACCASGKQRHAVYSAAWPCAVVLCLAVACAHGQHVEAPAVQPELLQAVERWEDAQPPVPGDTESRKYFRVRSSRLSRFWGRDMYLEAEVILPPHRDSSERLPVCYFIHGFDNWRLWAFRLSGNLIERLNQPALNYPRMVYVFPNAQFGLGHSVFADSANNGPWSEAFMDELVPAIEQAFGGWGDASGRFVSGHSSGGWSALWLLMTYPGAFGGAWAMAPDPVDFHAFTGVDIYTFDNAYADPEGHEIMLMRRGSRWVASFRQMTRQEEQRGRFAGQMDSFDNVFSPRGPDGLPMPMFNRETGAIDHGVTNAWKKYDIAIQLKAHWDQLGPRLQDKIHIYVGTLDTFRLNEAVALLKTELQNLGGDADIVMVDGASHGIFRPQPGLWPDGLETLVHSEMEAAFLKAHPEENPTTRQNAQRSPGTSSTRNPARG